MVLLAFVFPLRFSISWFTEAWGGYRYRCRDNMILSSYSLSFRLSVAIAPWWERGSGSQIL
jgi:hypothetical protein